MRLAVIAAVLTASASVASAGTYLGLGIGPAAGVNGDAGAYGSGSFEGAGRSYRLLGGFRVGRLAVEGSITGQDLLFTGNNGMGFEGRELAVAGVYSHPLGSGFEAYGKLGIHRTWLSADGGFDGMYDVSGDGLLVGGGFALRLNAVLASGAVFVDYTHHAADLSGDRYAFEGGVGMWMLGFTFGI